MHEGGHGILEKHDNQDVKKVEHFRRLKKWIFPGFMLLTIAVSLVPGQKEWLGFDLALVPMLLGGGLITFNTITAILKLHRITAGLLVVIALIGSAYIGEYLAGAIVAFMMILGEFLEYLTLEKTRNAVQALLELAPDTARVFSGGEWVEVPTDQVAIQDKVLVKPGERIPVDGKIVSGSAAINESTLTGESIPVDKTVEDTVFAGTTNEMGAIEIITEKIGDDTTLGRIIQVVYEAQEKKGKTQKIADRFAKYFTPIILLICVGVWFSTNEIIRVMAVLVIACPCALVLATPTAVVASVGNLARRGVLIKGGITLETAGRINTLCFDKTGTLTHGKPVVVAFESFLSHKKADILALAYAAESRSEHPLGKAIIDYASEYTTKASEVESFEQRFGLGVRAILNGNREVRDGNWRILEQEGIQQNSLAKDFLDQQERLGRTALLIVSNGEILGGIAVADTLREGVPEAIANLRQAGVKYMVMLTGDNRMTAQAIADKVSFDKIEAQLLPEEKLERIKGLKRDGMTVAMVGDGVNDAPALMLADVGIAMGAAGSDVAIESAGIVLMGNDLGLLTDVIVLSRRALKIIKQNIWGFAVAVNVIGITLAGTGVLSPIAAAIVHNISSAFVVLNSSRLLGFGRKPKRIRKLVQVEVGERP